MLVRRKENNNASDVYLYKASGMLVTLDYPQISIIRMGLGLERFG